MPLPILVKITDAYGQVVRGMAELYDEEDSVIGYAFDHNIHRILETEEDDGINVRHQPISFTKEVDNTSPLLNQFFAFGDELQKVEFFFYRYLSGGGFHKYYSITLEKAKIIRIKTYSKMSFLKKNEPYSLMDKIEFSYKTISWVHHNVNGSIMMSMDEVQEVLDDMNADPLTMKDYLYNKNLVSLMKQHPGMTESELKSIAISNMLGDMEWMQIKEDAKNNHWVELKYLYPDDSGVENIPYLVKLPDGKEESGKLTKDTVLRFENLPAGAVDTEFGTPVEEELFQIRKDIKSTLGDILKAKQEDTEKVLAELEEQGLIETSGSYVKAVSSGAWEGVKGLAELACSLGKISMLFNPTVQAGNALKASYRAFQNGDESKDSWIEQFGTQWNANRHEEYIDALGFDPSEIDPKQIAEAYELVALIMDDGPTYSIFLDFAEDYVKAQNRLDWAKMGGGAAFEIILGIVLAALTGGTSAVAQVGKKAQGFISDLGPMVKKLFALLKKKKLNIRFKGKVDATHVKKAKIPDGSKLPEQKIKKRPGPRSFSDATKRLEDARDRIKAHGYKPKYTQAELLSMADKGQLDSRFIVRVTDAKYANLTDNMGQISDGKVRYWSTTFDQIENADTDPKLLAEAVGTDYNPDKTYSMLIIDTNGAAKSGAHTIVPTHKNLGDFTVKELGASGEINPDMVKKVMTPEYNEEYLKIMEKIKADGLKIWDDDHMKDIKNTFFDSDYESNLFETRATIQNNYGANEYFTGNGLTKCNIEGLEDGYGVMETFTYEKSPKTLGDMIKNKSLIIENTKLIK